MAALLFEGVRLGLPKLLPRSQYELLYGPLAGFVLALLGLYLVLLSLLLGALVARVLED
jgi:membrane protein